jgi:hypothetical protein
MLRKDQKCANCDAYLPEGNDGFCRAHPAVPLFMGMSQPAVVHQGANNIVPMIQTHFPQMKPFGWCREWREKTAGEA